VGNYTVLLKEEGLWEAANAEISKRYFGRPAPHSSGAANLFTGIIKCAHCQGPISLRSGNDKGRVPALYCTNARDGACIATKSVHRHLVECAVLSALSSRIAPENILNNLNRAADVVDHATTIQRLTKELHGQEREVDRLTDRILQLADSDNFDLFEERLSRVRRERDELKCRILAAQRESDLAEAEVSQSVRAATDFRALVAAVVDGTPTVELSGPIEVATMRQALTEADRMEEKLTGEMESVRIRLKAALRRLVAAMEFNLQNGSFNIELHGQELVCSGPDEQEYAAKCEALPLLHGGLRMPEAHLLQPLARPE